MEKPLLSHAEALANATPIDWKEEDISQPSFIGRRVLAPIDLQELAQFIDWTFFFSAWELKGRFPAIFDDPTVGSQARTLYEDGVKLLGEMIDGEQIEARAVYGLWPAHSEGDDIVLYQDELRQTEAARFPMLRQQAPSRSGVPNRSLADFVAPRSSGLADHIGAFAITAGLGADALATQHEEKHDDYTSILVKALADRLAEAGAEWLHERVRSEWGYETQGSFSNDQLIGEKYRGIRPAFGYPACPDHTPKQTLFDLLDAEPVGLSLTESFMVQPGASVSGLYFAHPEARYFSIGRLGRDQIDDYARRCGMPLAEMERWLASNLGYEPKAKG